VGVGHHLPVLLDVAVVEALDRRVAEDEGGQGAAANGVDGHHPAGGVVDDDAPLVPGRGVQREGGDVDARIVDELGLGPEGQTAGGRVEPIGADHQVEPARRGLSNVTSTPPRSWLKAVIVPSNMYSAESWLA